MNKNPSRVHHEVPKENYMIQIWQKGGKKVYEMLLISKTLSV